LRTASNGFLRAFSWKKYPIFLRKLKQQSLAKTSCARGDTICPRPLLPVWAPRAAEPTAAPADGNVAAVAHAQYVPTLTAAAACA